MGLCKAAAFLLDFHLAFFFFSPPSSYLTTVMFSHVISHCSALLSYLDILTGDSFAVELTLQMTVSLGFVGCCIISLAHYCSEISQEHCFVYFLLLFYMLWYKIVWYSVVTNTKPEFVDKTASVFCVRMLCKDM